MQTEGLTEFLAVARSGSFTRAAESLGHSVAHISRQVSRLEERLGTRLFERSTRSVQLTLAGEALRTRIEALDEELEEALLSATEASRIYSGKVRITALPGTFADQVVGPALLDLAEAYPDLEIEVDFEARIVDLIGEGYDLAIRSGPLRETSLVARPLSRRCFAAAASPAYLEQHGTPSHPDDLIHHQCIRNRGDRWAFRVDDKPYEAPIKSRLSINVGPAIAEACLRGLGIAYMASSGFGTLLTSGALRPVLEPYWRSEMSIYAVYANRRFVPARIRLVMDHLAQKSGAFEAADRSIKQEAQALAPKAPSRPHHP